MIKAHEETIKKAKDPGVKLILQYIVDDEKRHHKIILDMIRNLLSIGS
jgi:hypothetical protein